MDFFKVVPSKRKVKIRGKNGIIFYNPPKWRKIIFGLGNGFFVAGIIYIFYIYFPLFWQIGKYEYRRITGDNNQIISVTNNTHPVIIEEAAKKDVFALQIPKLMANSEIIPQVPPFDQKEYLKALEDGKVAQAAGSAYPGQGKGNSTFIFAHSTNQGIPAVRNNAVFYLLGELKNGDPIFVSYKEKVFAYQVYDQKVVNASEIKYLSYKEDNNELLILQTCWPIGTDWKRLLVFAKRVGE